MTIGYHYARVIGVGAGPAGPVLAGLLLQRFNEIHRRIFKNCTHTKTRAYYSQTTSKVLLTPLHVVIHTQRNMLHHWVFNILNELCTSLTFFFSSSLWLCHADASTSIPCFNKADGMNPRKSKLCNFRSCYLCVRLYCNLSKIDPPLKISLHVSPFLIEVVAKGVLLSKVHPPFVTAVYACCYVKQEPPKKQYCARGGTNKGKQTSFA